MITREPEGGTSGEAAEGPRRIEEAEGVRTYQSSASRIPEARHLAENHTDWAFEAMGEALYIRTFWISKWHGNDSFRSKTNRRKK